MNTTIMRLKTEIHSLALAGTKTCKEIQGLVWKEGSLAEVQKLRAQQDADGHRVVGKKTLKQYHRPETGAERNELWGCKRATGHKARIALLTYGLLRGRAYATMEGVGTVQPWDLSWEIRACLDRCCKWNADRDTKKALIEAWFKGDATPKILALSQETVQAKAAVA